MDVTRDDTATGTSILQATATSLSISSSAAANQLTADGLGHHYVLTLTRSGTGLQVSLQKDGNAAISGTDATPTGFVFDEAVIGVRSNSAMDTRWDNMQVEYIPGVPEPASFSLLGIGAVAAMLRRTHRH